MKKKYHLKTSVKSTNWLIASGQLLDYINTETYSRQSCPSSWLRRQKRKATCPEGTLQQAIGQSLFFCLLIIVAVDLNQHRPENCSVKENFVSDHHQLVAN